ncbi:MAG TPA: HAMP domain-containing sensor histidine kinase [Gaiellaceae bacterium]|nr:HAMP domain-containing sensor histidine kinase [Gaiellaceae bacterium]
MTPGEERDRLAILVHEVRSPVAALGAIREALLEGDLDPAARRELAALAAAACRGIERIVGDAAVSSVRLEEVDIAKVVQEAVAATSLAGSSTRVDPGPGPIVVEADPFRLRQALDNLVANAVAHSPPGGEVLVGARVEKGRALVTVADSGPGVPLEEQERIFEAGVRLDTGRPGSGLGLSIARAIAEAHGGSLTVDSEPGRGAVFVLSLPLERRQPAT